MHFLLQIKGLWAEFRVGLAACSWLKLQPGWYLLDVFSLIMDYVINILKNSKSSLIFLTFTDTANHLF